MTSEALEVRVIDLVSLKSGHPIWKINRSSSFYRLGIDGDDAAEFMEEYARTFDVDMTGFNPSEYYGPEAASILLIGKPPQKNLTIDLLIRSAEVKKWLDGWVSS